ncbi:MAG: MerR family transcriptional regulator [bacterium]|nr:MerR family transcriptional regulator [bacterium]
MFRMVEIPNKLYFNIGEVSALTGLEPHVLRFWENEFNELKPKKTKTGRRAYQRKDIEVILNIKQMLYEQHFTIQGARRQLHLKKEGVSDIKKHDDKFFLLRGIRERLIGLQQDIYNDKQHFSNAGF